MTEANMFEQFKADALNSYAQYLDKIEEFSYEDLTDVNKRIDLLDAYNKSVLSNAVYRNFISESVQNSLKIRIAS